MAVEREFMSEATDAARAVVLGAAGANLAGPTPCREFDLAGLVDHWAGTTGAMARIGRGEALDSENPWGSDHAASIGDWPAEITANLDTIASGWAAPERWDGTIDAGGQEWPAEMIGRMAFAEVLLHGWDLTQATGQELTLPAPVAAALRQFVEDTGEMGREQGVYGPAVPVADGDDDLTAALKLAGRDPAWAPAS